MDLTTNNNQPQAGGKTVDRTTYRSLATNQPAPYEYDKKMAAVKQARTIADPLKAGAPHLQLQSLNAKLLRLYGDPKYQGLSTEHKMLVLKHYYSKYTDPVLKANGVNPPDFEHWAAGYHNPSYDKQTQTPDAGVFRSYQHGVREGGADALRLVGNVLHFSATHSHTNLGRDKIIGAGNYLRRKASGLDQVNQDFESSFQVGHSVSSWLANTIGHTVGEAPAYIAIGAATDGAGIAIAPMLGERAVMSAGISLGLKVLKGAGEIFAIDKGEGKGTKQATLDAAVGAGMHYATHLAWGGATKARLKFKAAQTAVAGEPFSNSIARTADNIDPFHPGHAPLHEEAPKTLGKGAGYEQGSGAITDEKRLLSAGTPDKITSYVRENDPHLQQAAINEAWLRENVSRQFHPEKAAKLGEDKSLWRTLGVTQRAKVKTYIGSLTKLSAETMPLHSPELQTAANNHEITQWSRESPTNNQLLENIKKLTGLDPASVLTEAQAKEVAIKHNINTPTQILDIAGNDSEEYEPGEGASASLSPGFKVSYLKRNDSLTPAKLATSNASDFVHGTIKYLEKSPATKSGHIYYENPEHHLLAISRNSSAPPSVKAQATLLLKREFGHTAEKINTRAAWLKEHVDDLKRTGLISEEGNIFRSTKLTARRYGTKFQKELYTEDMYNTQMNEIKQLVKMQPKFKGLAAKMFKELNSMRTKANTPAKANVRGASADELVRFLKGIE